MRKPSTAAVTGRTDCVLDEYDHIGLAQLVGDWGFVQVQVPRGDVARRERWATRAAGLVLAAASAWALGHGLWSQIAAFCATL